MSKYQFCQLKALQNACSSIYGLTVKENFEDDRRKTIKRFFVTLNGVRISPALDFENLNHFILGIHIAKQNMRLLSMNAVANERGDIDIR